MRIVILAILALTGIGCSSSAVRDVAEVAAMSGGPVGTVLVPIVEWQTRELERSEADAWQAKNEQHYTLKLASLQSRDPVADAHEVFGRVEEAFLLLAPNHRFYLGIEQIPKSDTREYYKQKVESDAQLTEIQSLLRWHQDDLLGSEAAIRNCFNASAQHYTAAFNQEMGRLSGFYITDERFMERTFAKPDCDRELLDYQISQFD